MVLLERLQTGQSPSLEFITSKSIPLQSFNVSLKPHLHICPEFIGRFPYHLQETSLEYVGDCNSH